MKTPEEIKCGLEMCRQSCFICHEECPYMETPCSQGDEVMKDAIAYIQQLEQDNAQKDERIRELEQLVPSWVSVKERYPENRKLVLFGYAEQKFVSIGYFDEEGAEWCDTEDNEVVRPTHWTPLPATPDNEKEGQLNDRYG